ncbi:hypothetical protein Tco_1580460 [Tanacetum coccineum]
MRFVRALNNLNSTKRSPHDGQENMFRRSRRVKIAAYTAMASVVGSRRAWSRALLWKIRNRSRNRGLLLRITKRVDHAKVSFKRRNPRPKRQDFDPFKYSSQELKLRKMVPGAETMDSCSLMCETADYIKCLVAQVEIMKSLVDLYTNV